MSKMKTKKTKSCHTVTSVVFYQNPQELNHEETSDKPKFYRTLTSIVQQCQTQKDKRWS
jgi:hypothetical protein